MKQAVLKVACFNSSRLDSTFYSWLQGRKLAFLALNWRDCSTLCSTLLLALVLAIPAFATDQAKTESLAFHVTRSLLIVEVTIDGQKKNLIFDTGAERTLVQDNRNVEHMSTLIVGCKTLTNFPVAFVSLSGMQMEKIGADGVLGQDVLKHFSSVRIDYKTNTIELQP